MATTKTLKVEGMSCGHCASAVKNALEGLSGVHAARVDLEGKRAEVDFEEDKVQTSAMVAAIEDEGYSAEALP